MTLLAFYTSRHNRLVQTLVNPSKAHLQRLHTAGHDIILELYNDRGELVKKAELKY